jgi:hypothetical protein
MHDDILRSLIQFDIIILHIVDVLYSETSPVTVSTCLTTKFKVTDLTDNVLTTTPFLNHQSECLNVTAKDSIAFDGKASIDSILI